jgi:hypothetical protein
MAVAIPFLFMVVSGFRISVVQEEKRHNEYVSSG